MIHKVCNSSWNVYTYKIYISASLEGSPVLYTEHRIYTLECDDVINIWEIAVAEAHKDGLEHVRVNQVIVLQRGLPDTVLNPHGY